MPQVTYVGNGNFLYLPLERLSFQGGYKYYALGFEANRPALEDLSRRISCGGDAPPSPHWIFRQEKRVELSCFLSLYASVPVLVVLVDWTGRGEFQNARISSARKSIIVCHTVAPLVPWEVYVPLVEETRIERVKAMLGYRGLSQEYYLRESFDSDFRQLLHILA